MKTFTADELRAWVAEQYDPETQPSAWRLINGWLARGDGVALYENHDLGHPELGNGVATSYGSPAAQLETGTPPERLPDGLHGGQVNWRYVLVGTYRGPELLP